MNVLSRAKIVHSMNKVKIICNNIYIFILNKKNPTLNAEKKTSRILWN